MFENRCPMCGTFGQRWNKDPEVFFCPNCTSLFSPFGLVHSPMEEDFDFSY